MKIDSKPILPREIFVVDDAEMPDEMKFKLELSEDRNQYDHNEDIDDEVKKYVNIHISQRLIMHSRAQK